MNQIGNAERHDGLSPPRFVLPPYSSSTGVRTLLTPPHPCVGIPIGKIGLDNSHVIRGMAWDGVLVIKDKFPWNRRESTQLINYRPQNSQRVLLLLFHSMKSQHHNTSEVVFTMIEFGMVKDRMTSDELPIWRKHMVVFVVSWMGLMATFSITSLLTAIPEIASELLTTVEVINVTNAITLIAMGVSSLIWSPLSEIFGRRLIYNVAIFLMVIASIGVAVAPNMAVFTATRLACGFTGTFFMVAGQIIITDIFEPAVRGRATACLMVGSVAGPALGINTSLAPFQIHVY